MMRGSMMVALLVAAAFAGCSDGGASDPVEDADFNDLGLEATGDTGVIRGVVVDATITPVADAAITIASTGESTTSNEAGAFGFSGLPAGSYFLDIEKAGYGPVQQSVEVVAGVAEPPAVKVLLEEDPSSLPFIQAFKFDGFIECSVSAFAAGIALCSQAGSANDVFIEEYTLDGTPQWAQGEMTWESTQALGDRMTLLFSAPGESTLLDNYGEAEGVSPLTVTADEETLQNYSVGQGQSLMVRVFNAPVEGTDPGDPVNGDDCNDRPVLGGCTTGLGATVNQEFTVFTHTFYNMVPRDGWTFVADGPHELP